MQDSPKTAWLTEKKALRSLLALSVIAATFVTGLYLGSAQGVSQAASFVSTIVVGSDEPPQDVDASTLWRAWRILDDRFVKTSTSTEPTTTDEKLWGALEGLAKSYGDPYTVFLPPQETEAFTEDISGNFEGVGMEIGIRDDVLIVVSPLKGTPAERAGLQPGDRLLLINDQPTENLSVEKAVKMIRGPHSTLVKFLVGRNGVVEPFTVSVMREVIQIPSMTTTLRSDGIFVMSLYNFSAISPQRFREALREFVESGSIKLILDLRGNPGGFLEASVDMASWFLPLGKPVVIEDFAGKQENVIYRSKGYDVFRGKKISMVILVNQGSASASEILAGALREHGVAKLIGERTFGKGSVQELIDLGKGASLKVTIARWLTPNGISISDGGLTPDIEIKRTATDVKEGKDPELDAAVVHLLNIK